MPTIEEILADETLIGIVIGGVTYSKEQAKELFNGLEHLSFSQIEEN